MLLVASIMDYSGISHDSTPVILSTSRHKILTLNQKNFLYCKARKVFKNTVGALVYGDFLSKFRVIVGLNEGTFSIVRPEKSF